MWIQVNLSETQLLLIASCYLPPKGLRYAKANNSNQGTKRGKQTWSVYSVLEDYSVVLKVREVLFHIGNSKARMQIR